MTQWESDLAELDASTERLLATVADLSDADCAAPSVLPDWSRGHVLAHIEGNARGMGRLVRWATDGLERPMYISREVRHADVVLNARRTADEQFDAVRQSARDLRSLLGALPLDGLDARIVLGTGVEKAIGELPFHRLQEVCVHHVDLGLPSYTYLDWPIAMCTGMLANVAKDFAQRGEFPVRWLQPVGDERVAILGADGPGLEGSPQVLLAWLLNRPHDASLIRPVGTDGVPTAPTWR